MTATLAREAVAPARLRGRVWVSYARLSKAKNDGRGGSLAIDRQHKENRAYVEHADPGARVIELQDDGYSGFLDVYRPAFEQALGLVERREVHALVGWHADRLTRQVEVTARIVRACETARVELHTTLGGWHTDPTRIYVESVIAEGESRQKRNRMVSKHEQLAEAGGFAGGGRRFGYEPDMSAIRDDERALIVEAARRALIGNSMASIARWLSTETPTVTGLSTWSPTTVKNMLVSPHLAGIRTHTVDKETREYPAAWEHILELPTHKALRALLTNPSRRNSFTSANKYLLSGIAVCGREECGAKVRGAWIADRGTHKYRCTTCNRITRDLAETDAVVREYVVARLTEMDAAGVLVSDAANTRAADLTAARDAVTAERAELEALLKAGRLGAVGYANGDAVLVEREAELDAELDALAAAAAAPIRALEGATGPDAARNWDAWTEDPTGEGLGRQRAIVEFLVDVAILPTVRGARKFRSESVRVTFRDPVVT